jgi:hypothetical protein
MVTRLWLSHMRKYVGDGDRDGEMKCRINALIVATHSSIRHKVLSMYTAVHRVAVLVVYKKKNPNAPPS